MFKKKKWHVAWQTLVRAKQMCIPWLPWVILGTLETYTYIGRGRWFQRRESGISLGCIGGGRKSGAGCKEKLLYVPRSWMQNRAGPLYAEQRTHSVRLYLLLWY